MERVLKKGILPYFLMLFSFTFFFNNCTSGSEKAKIQKQTTEGIIKKKETNLETNASNFLFFSSTKKREKHLYRLNLKTKKIEQITFGKHYNSYPEVFNQKKLRYIQGTDGDFFIMN